jgi:hypothetical protein
MGYKSRGNFNIGFCTKSCLNRGDLCKTCVRFSNFKEDIYAGYKTLQVKVTATAGGTNKEN